MTTKQTKAARVAAESTLKARLLAEAEAKGFVEREQAAKKENPSLWEKIKKWF